MAHLFIIVAWLATSVAWADEPAYCNLTAFRGAEIDARGDTQRLKNLHLYRLGSVVLAGLAVGDSKVKQVKDLAREYSDANEDAGFCTFYLNNGKRKAEEYFNWENLPNPAKLDALEAPKIYRNRLRPWLRSSRAKGFVDCMSQFGYVALGCNGMEHRGPTVFGMLLAFSGCTPESASKIVNSIWGLNGVDRKVRLAIIREGAELAANHPAASSEARRLLSEPAH